MKTLAPLDLISAHNWTRATFTAYAFSAAFTEAVLIEALMRQGVSEIVILTDQLGYRMALRERGAVRVGREYLVFPVAVPAGCFHPKLMVLEAADGIHATVSSGNLTFGGWSANLECVEHIHTDGMSLAVADLADFFSVLATSQACTHDAHDYCRTLADRLTQAASRGRDDGKLRLAHSLSRSIADAIGEAVSALGGAKGATVVSPYWDAKAIEHLRSLLSLSEIRGHVAPTRIPAPAGMDWPRKLATIRPIELVSLVQGGAGSRGLHAKIIEIICSKGRLLVAGSANATMAGLFHGGETARNVEVCAIRRDLPGRHPWKFVSATVPSKPSETLEALDSEVAVGILVAAHSPDGIEGRILTSWNASSAIATIEINRVPIGLGRVAIADGRFAFSLDLLGGSDLSLEGRIQLRLEAEGQLAEGFVASPHFALIKSRSGKALSSMLATLKHLHTPQDVLAVMDYFLEHPEALRVRPTFRRASELPAAERPDPLVDPKRVGSTSGSPSQDNPAGGPTSPASEQAWQHFVARLLLAFANTKTTIEDTEDDADRAETVRRKRATEANDKLGMRFPEIFRKLSEAVQTDIELINLLRLTHYVCVTSDHLLTSSFLSRLISLAKGIEIGWEAQQSLAWSIAYLAARGAEFDAATARGKMLTLGIDPVLQPDSEFALEGFGNLIAPEADIAAVFEAIRNSRTVYDDVRLLEIGLDQERIPKDLSALPYHESWPKLLEQCEREPPRRRIHFVEQPVTACPVCHTTLLPDLRLDLIRDAICFSNCHGFILARNP